MPFSQRDIARVTAPEVIRQKLILEADLLVGKFFDPYRIKMKISANLGQVRVNVNEDGLVTAL
jgi:hypothetical protein